MEIRDNERIWGKERSEEAAQLRRHLTYYIQLMKDNKQEA